MPSALCGALTLELLILTIQVGLNGNTNLFKQYSIPRYKFELKVLNTL